MKEFAEAVKAHGGLISFAGKVGVRYQAIQYWLRRGIPPRRVLDVERVTGISREVLRPDLYPPMDSAA